MAKPAYFTVYRSLKVGRDAQGVLVAELRSNGGPLSFTAQDHTEFVEAFYQISQDRGNKIVVLTGAGGDFIPGIDFSSFGNVADLEVWSQVHDVGTQILENLANIRVPLIAAIEGRAHVHSEYALLANVIVASQGATFHDVPHFAGDIVPGDGIFTTWELPGRSRKSGGVPAGAAAIDCAYRSRMGSGGRGRAGRASAGLRS
jgi:enoyl-CoA hydratase/carnithine racemase